MQGLLLSGMDGAMSVKGKRALEKGEADNGNDVIRRKKRSKYCCCSVMSEAFKQGLLPPQRCAMMEPLLRKVVREEIEGALLKLGSNGPISFRKQLKCAGSRNFCLQFKNKLASSIFTQDKVEDDEGLPISIELQDLETGKVVTTGPESAAKLELVVLRGDFDEKDDEDWIQEKFETYLVKERKGKRPLLTGSLCIVLKEGVGTLGEVTFTDNSSWTTSSCFRLGVRLVPEFSEGLCIREGKSVAFKVKDHRGKYYTKHHRPAPNDDVWRLVKIIKSGSYHTKLNDKGIKNVEQFLTFFKRDPQELRNILKMSNKVFEDVVAHAQMCNLKDKPDEDRSVVSLTDNNKVYPEQLVKEMYETSAKTNSGNISEDLDEVRGVGGYGEGQMYSVFPNACHGQSTIHTQHAAPPAYVQQSSMIPSVLKTTASDEWRGPSTRYTTQNKQPAQNGPTSELLSSEAPMCAPMCSSNEGFAMGASLEASTYKTSQCYDDFFVLSPQTSQGGLVENVCDRELDVSDYIPANYIGNSIPLENPEQVENEHIQELSQMRYSHKAGTLNLQGGNVPVFQSFAQFPVDPFGVDKGGRFGNSSVRLLKLKAVLQCMIFIRNITPKKPGMVSLEDWVHTYF